MSSTPPHDTRWRPGALFGVLVAVLAMVGVGWLISSQGSTDPEPPAPTPILLPPPSGLDEDVAPPSADAGFGTPTPQATPSTQVWPDPSAMTSLAGTDPIVARVSPGTALVLTGGRLSYLDLAGARINWDVPATGTFASAPGSGAVVEVAPDGAAISRVVLTGDVMSRGHLLGRPALCGDLLLDIGGDSVDVYRAAELGEKVWSVSLDDDVLAGVETRHLDCWEEGRWWYVGDHPQYRLRVAPATREAHPVRGMAGETARVDMADAPTGEAVVPGTGPAAEPAVDAHGNLCLSSSADAVGLGEVTLECHGAEGAVWEATVAGQRISNVDGIWVITDEGSVSLFQ